MVGMRGAENCSNHYPPKLKRRRVVTARDAANEDCILTKKLLTKKIKINPIYSVFLHTLKENETSRHAKKQLD